VRGYDAPWGRLGELKVIDWPLALSTASQAIKLVNELRSADKELSQSELKLKIADLNTALADLKMTLTDAKSDAAEKDAEIARLKKLQRRLEDETVELYGYRYRKRKDGKEGGAGNPFCDVCLQKDGLLIETAFVHGTGIQQLQCPNCNAKYAKLHTYTD
jgi:rubrerythrin